MNPALVDSHAHLSDLKLWDDRAAVMTRAASEQVAAVLSVGYDLETSRRAAAWAQVDRRTAAAVGIHPTSILEAGPDDFTEVELLSAGPEVAAVGETGLDFYWESAPPDRQREVFRWHLDLALRRDLPVTIHSRNAESEVLDVLSADPSPNGAVHCFGGNLDQARRALELGLYIGVAGPVTFKKSEELQELVRWLPLDRILLETDSPYLSPHPFRGKLNEPSRIILIAKKIAELRNLTLEEVMIRTTTNALTLFPRLGSRLSESGAQQGPDPSS